MMGFNSHEDKFVTKATGYDVKRREPKDNVLFLSKSESDRLSMKTDTKPCFIAFDILYLNGEVHHISLYRRQNTISLYSQLLTERPLEKRKELLLATFPALRTSCSQVSEMVKDCFETDVTDEIEQHCRLLSLFPVIRGALYLGGFVFTDADKVSLKPLSPPPGKIRISTRPSMPSAYCISFIVLLISLISLHVHLYFPRTCLPDASTPGLKMAPRVLSPKGLRRHTFQMAEMGADGGKSSRTTSSDYLRTSTAWLSAHTLNLPAPLPPQLVNHSSLISSAPFWVIVTKAVWRKGHGDLARRNRCPSSSRFVE